MKFNAQPSGDYLADRRYQHATALANEGDHAAAAELFVQTLERTPKWAAAWFGLAEARAQSGRREEALAAYHKCRHFDRQDTFGASLRIARLNAGEAPPATAPPAYVRSLFDGYAARFDEHLTQSLHYRGPALLLDALERACAACGRDCRFGRAADLGCGTGLVGKALDGRAASLTGVDLSPQMLAEAAKTGLYETLHAMDAATFLARADTGRFDLALAADVLIYIGDLQPLFGGIAQRLGADGLFAFTAQTHDGEGCRLGKDLRFAHGRDHVRACLAAAGLGPILFEDASVRTEGTVDVPGVICIARRFTA